MLNELLEALDVVIENEEKIVVMISSGISTVCSTIIPDSYDVDEDRLTLYVGEDLYAFGIKNVNWDEENKCYFCFNDATCTTNVCLTC